MKKNYVFLAKPTSLLQEAQAEAHRLGLEDLYIIQEVNQERWLLGGTSCNTIPETLKHLELSSVEQPLDWNNQSALFSPYFSEGRIRIPLKEFSDSEAILQLEPGCGFGDMSHSTTRLTLKAMQPLCKKNYVLDIGCGNGILSLAAALMGAEYVNGLDIDPEALSHAARNKELNGLKNVEFTSSPTHILCSSPSLIALMNMTFLEQKMAWTSLHLLHKHIAVVVVSGILVEQKEKYLQWSKENKWDLLSESSEESWSCFTFVNRTFAGSGI